MDEKVYKPPQQEESLPWKRHQPSSPQIDECELLGDTSSPPLTIDQITFTSPQHLNTKTTIEVKSPKIETSLLVHRIKHLPCALKIPIKKSQKILRLACPS